MLCNGGNGGNGQSGGNGGNGHSFPYSYISTDWERCSWSDKISFKANYQNVYKSNNHNFSGGTTSRGSLDFPNQRWGTQGGNGGKGGAGGLGASAGQFEIIKLSSAGFLKQTIGNAGKNGSDGAGGNGGSGGSHDRDAKVTYDAVFPEVDHDSSGNLPSSVKNINTSYTTKNPARANDGLYLTDKNAVNRENLLLNEHKFSTEIAAFKTLAITAMAALNSEDSVLIKTQKELLEDINKKLDTHAEVKKKQTSSASSQK